MARTTAEISQQIDELLRARSSGVADISYGGQRVTYRSLSEIDAAIAAARRELAEVQAPGGATTPIVRQYRFASRGRGL